MRVLLIEDDVDLATTIADYLAVREVAVEHAYDGMNGLHLAATTRPDVVVLDIGLPGLSGFEVCGHLREKANSGVPILMLTARDSVEDKIAGFDQGADDYLVKPFALDELYCRLQALTRRGNRLMGAVISVADLEVDTKARTATRQGQDLPLSKLEFDLLATLCAASPAAVGKNELIRAVWGDVFVESETIRAHIYQLRQIIDRPFKTPLIHTIRGYGHAIKVLHA